MELREGGGVGGEALLAHNASVPVCLCVFILWLHANLSDGDRDTCELSRWNPPAFRRARKLHAGTPGKQVRGGNI